MSASGLIDINISSNCYKSKYMICVALIAPQKLRKLATLTTAVVVPDQITIEPMHKDSTNCARNTMLLTMATSVPRPRTSVPTIATPVASVANCKQSININENCGVNF